jgi:hypothetical protein
LCPNPREYVLVPVQDAATVPTPVVITGLTYVSLILVVVV